MLNVLKNIKTKKHLKKETGIKGYGLSLQNFTRESVALRPFPDQSGTVEPLKTC